MGWDPATGQPTLKRLQELGIEDLVPAFE